MTVRRAAAAAVCGEGSLTMSRASAFAFHEQCTLSRLSPRATLQALQAVMQALGQGIPNMIKLPPRQFHHPAPLS